MSRFLCPDHKLEALDGIVFKQDENKQVEKFQCPFWDASDENIRCRACAKKVEGETKEEAREPIDLLEQED